MAKKGSHFAGVLLAIVYFASTATMLSQDRFEVYFILIFPWSWLLTIFSFLIVHVFSNGLTVVGIGMWVGAIINSILVGILAGKLIRDLQQTKTDLQ